MNIKFKTFSFKFVVCLSFPIYIFKTGSLSVPVYATFRPNKTFTHMYALVPTRERKRLSTATFVLSTSF